MKTSEVFAQLARDPRQLIRNWNWKSACISAGIRALIYLFTNLGAGWKAGLISMLVEATYRVPLSGLCGSFTQAFRKVKPAWAATLVIMVCLPVFTHSCEFFIHWLQGAPRLRTSFTVSVSFTILAALFNLFAMRRGSFVVGGEGKSFSADLRRTPALIGAFIAALPLALYRRLRGSNASATLSSVD